MTLEYLREYLPYFHANDDFGISGSVCYKISKNIEDNLSKSKEFRLPKRLKQ